MSSGLLVALAVGPLFAAAFFVLWNTSQIGLGALSSVFISNYVRRRTVRNRALAGRLASPPLVSVIVPAYNEALTIVESVRALLALDYESREVVVVNDGSSDGTLQVLKRTFQLLPAPVAYVQPLLSEPVRGIYRSVLEPSLVVIDKGKGGKSDAINAGINAASGQLVLMVDADTVLAPDGLSRAVLPFFEDPRTVAVAGNVAIANGCRFERGQLADVLMPRSWLARFQIVEYMRSFLLFRAACASLNAITVISGAFGLFRRDAVIAVGGYDRSAIGEDIDLTLRLQQFYRRRRQPFRIAFDPFPLCSTQVPEDLSSLRAQRCRWRRGLLETLWGHRRMMGNPRYGIVGMGALPYMAIFEGLGPLLEIAAYIIVTVAALTGILGWHHYFVFMMISLSFGVAATLCAVLLSDIATRRYMHGRDLTLLVAVAILENFGYRQMISWWACVGTVQVLAGKRGWGVVKRRVFEGDETPVQSQRV
jgi:cellulose synthase/poly-beta-1,6-N-acetylglucosamine synthase-like glycosyltransferase